MSDYKTQLNEKLAAAQARLKQGREVKQLKASSPTLFEIMDTEISLAVNKMTQEEPLSDRDYLQAHGYVRGIMKIRNLLNSKEAEEASTSKEVEAIQGQLEQFEDDKKQK